MGRKIRYERVFLFLLFVIFLVILVICFFSQKIKKISVNGNFYLSDQDIIESAHLSDYPNAFFTTSRSIRSNLEKNKYIKSADVKKTVFGSVSIEVVENKPLVFSSTANKVVLSDGSYVDDYYNVPILINDVDSSIFNDFLDQLSLLDFSVFSNISEIEYSPNSVDNKLFLFYMNDGNYIYVDLDRFSSVNRYFDIVVNFNNHKGILYLDSGEYFKILDN